MDKIIDNLYLGDIQGASNLFLLKRNNITHILQVAAGFKPFFPGEFKYKVINVLDMPYENLIKHFQTGIEFIKQGVKNGNVLVHCYAGISRSSSLIIAYLMQEHGMTMYDALSLTRRRRPIVFPNPGFQRQLLDFERLLVRNGKRNQQQQQQSPHKQSQVTPKPAHKGASIEHEQKYGSLSADKGYDRVSVNNFALAHLRQSAERGNYSKGYSNTLIDRAQTSQIPLRKSINDVQIKQEIQNRMQVIPQNQMKSGRAKSSYGQSRSKQGQSQRNDGMRPSNTVQTLEIRENPLAQSQQQLHKYGSSKNSNNTGAPTMFNSLNRPNGGQESAYFNQNELKEFNQYNENFSKSVANLQYACALCRHPLFTSADVIDHSHNIQTSERVKSVQTKDRFMINANQVFNKTSNDFGTHKCGSLFIKKKEWINEQDGSQGNIQCPRKACAVKIGTYCWQGQRCSTCGQFVVPAFQIFRNRIHYGQGLMLAAQPQQPQIQMKHELQSSIQNSGSPQTKKSATNNFDNKGVNSYSADVSGKRKQNTRQQSTQPIIQEDPYRKVADKFSSKNSQEKSNSNHKKANTFLSIEGQKSNAAQINNLYQMLLQQEKTKAPQHHVQRHQSQKQRRH